MTESKVVEAEKASKIATNEAIQSESEAASAIELTTMEEYTRKKQTNSVIIKEAATNNIQTLTTEKVEIE